MNTDTFNDATREGDVEAGEEYESQVFRDPMDVAEQGGLVCVLPGPMEIQIDLDTEEDYQQHLLLAEMLLRVHYRGSAQQPSYLLSLRETDGPG